LGDACIRLVVPVGVSYGDDPDTVTRVLLEVGRAEPEALSDPEPHVFFAGFGDSALNFELRVFLNGTDGLVPVRNRLNTAIKKAFDAEGIRIPFPQRDVHVAMVSRQDPEGGPHAPLPPPDHGDETSSDGTAS
jgi:small-conductance mechanosensitive channel